MVAGMRSHCLESNSTPCKSSAALTSQEWLYFSNEAGRLVPAIARGTIRLTPAYGLGGVRPQLLDTERKVLVRLPVV